MSMAKLQYFQNNFSIKSRCQVFAGFPSYWHQFFLTYYEELIIKI